MMMQDRPGTEPARVSVRGDGNAVSTSTGSGSASANVHALAAPGTADALARIDELLAAIVAAVQAVGGTGATALPEEDAEEIIEEADRLKSEIHRRRLSPEHIALALRNLTRAAAPVVSLLAQVDDISEFVASLLH
jgi:hypothetical protein